MTAFLEIVAQQLWQQYQGRLHEVAVVFPNRRQSVFFAHYLRQQAKAPAFLPEMLTIEELVSQSSALPMADSLTQSFALYDAFAAVSREAGDHDIPPFDVFFSIGETILKDFKELDSYLADVRKVCQVLFDLETIDTAFDQLSDEQKAFLRSFWQGASSRSSVQEKFLKLWQRLPAIYEGFSQRLQAQGLSYLGAAYRALAAGHASAPHFGTQWQHVAFVGFNAFNKAEETFVSRWQAEGWASCWFDADDWYLQDTRQEAGFFLRRNMQTVGLKNALAPVQAIGTRRAPIQVVAVEGQHAQAKQIKPWWEQLPEDRAQARVGILLADESLLMPVLQSLPPGLPAVNVSMGYPMQQSAVYSLLRLFFEVQQDMATHRYQTVHHALVTRWLQHPFCGVAGDTAAELQARMIKENLVRVPLCLLQNLTEAEPLLFTQMMADLQVFDRLRQLLEWAVKTPMVAEDALLQGLCVAAWHSLQQLQPLFASLQPLPNLPFIASLLTKQIGSLSVPFEGELLQGVQVMGLLESRGLDFDHLLVLGASEGSLPRIKPPDSFLPHNIRRAYGLPVPEHQDAIFAYVFYRLLHRCQSMTLVYNALVTDTSTGEVSRFVQQLAFESNIPIQYSQVQRAAGQQASAPITIQKDDALMRRLLGQFFTDNGGSISPSAINTYLNCRLQFFFKYIGRLQAPEELEESVEANKVGSVVHRLMELLYQEAVAAMGSSISQQHIDWMLERRELLVEQAFKDRWRSKPVEERFEFSGELLVVRAVVLHYAQLLLEVDRAYTPFTWLNNEEKLAHPFEFLAGGQQRKINIVGHIDRVDEKDGVYRMLDYKTGSDEPGFRNVAALFERDGRHQNKAALQTLIYSWLFQQAHPEWTRFEPALVAPRYLNSNRVADTRLQELDARQPVSAERVPELLSQMKTHLADLLAELLDPQVPFDQTTDVARCRHCEFAGICGRQ
jgi:hypothetical protein